MTLLNKDTFICFDCESTGLDVDSDRIIEIAAMRFTFDTIIDKIEFLVDPQIPIPPESMAIHNITPEMVSGKPTIDAVLPEILAFIGDSTIVGHGIPYDIAMIINSAKRNSIPCSLAKNKVIDTLRLARLYGESPSNALGVLKNHFSIECSGGAHRAMNDVIVNVEVFKKLVAHYKMTEEIFAALAKPIMMRSMPLGKYKGVVFKDIPDKYLLWARHQKFDEDLLYSLSQEIKRRRKSGSFSQSANPFSSL